MTEKTRMTRVGHTTDTTDKFQKTRSVREPHESRDSHNSNESPRSLTSTTHTTHSTFMTQMSHTSQMTHTLPAQPPPGVNRLSVGCRGKKTNPKLRLFQYLKGCEKKKKENLPSVSFQEGADDLRCFSLHRGAQSKDLHLKNRKKNCPFSALWLLK